MISILFNCLIYTLSVLVAVHVDMHVLHLRKPKFI